MDFSDLEMIILRKDFEFREIVNNNSQNKKVHKKCKNSNAFLGLPLQ